MRNRNNINQHELEYSIQMSTRGHIDNFNMMVVGKYFESVDDFMNVVMVNKKYRDMTAKYRYNPIKLNDEKSRKMFMMIETQHVYSENDKVCKNGTIKRHVYWYQMSYRDHKEKSREGGEGEDFKCVQFTNSDRIENEEIIPECVSIIESRCFGFNESLSSISIPSSVSVIGKECFEFCKSLSSLSIPSSVTKIGSACFIGCSNLTNLIIDPRNEYYAMDDGSVFNKDKTQMIVYLPNNRNSSYSIPSTVTEIGDQCFKYCSSLSSITIPSSVSRIGHMCFYNCSSLSSLSIPSSVSEIGNICLFLCSSLTSLSLPQRFQSEVTKLFTFFSNHTNDNIPQGCHITFE